MLFETTKLLAKKFRKKLCEGELWRKGGCLRSMILPTKGMMLGWSLERSTPAIECWQIYARIYLFSRKKYQSLIFAWKMWFKYLICNKILEMRLLGLWVEKSHWSLIEVSLAFLTLFLLYNGGKLGKNADSGAKSCFFRHFWHHYRQISPCARRMVCLCPSHGHPQPTLWASVARALGNYCP